VPPGHVVPPEAGGLEQMPVEVLHVPAVWHASIAVHTVGVPLHRPAWQVSVPLHLLPSVHVVPSVTFTCLQPVAGSHESVVQG
jgi:hypothetical protein